MQNNSRSPNFNQHKLLKCNKKEPLDHFAPKLFPLYEKSASNNTSSIHIKIISGDYSTVILFRDIYSGRLHFCTNFAKCLEIQCKQGLRIHSFLLHQSIIPHHWEYFNFFDDPLCNGIAVCRNHPSRHQIEWSPIDIQ